MNLVGLSAELFAFLELLGDVRVAGGSYESGEPVEPGDNPVLDPAGGHATRPAEQARDAEAAFQGRSLAARERRLAAIRPGKVLRAVVGREHHDRVAVET